VPSVLVEEPWPEPHLFVPRDSTVEMHRTAGERSYSPYWLIDLANDTKSFPLQFNQEKQLNSHNVYQLHRWETPGMPPTLRLLMNDTVRNNGTKIQCDRSETSESTTTLYVIGMAYNNIIILFIILSSIILTSPIKIVDPIMILLTGDTVGMGINLSWSLDRTTRSG
jgi:hypothetical protein